MTVKIDLAELHPGVEQLPEDFGDGDPCPKCQSTATATGYGLAGGSMGPYAYCLTCNWLGKRIEEDR